MSEVSDEYRVTCADGYQIHNLRRDQVEQHLSWHLPSGPANCGPHVVEKRTVTTSDWVPISWERGRGVPAASQENRL